MGSDGAGTRDGLDSAATVLNAAARFGFHRAYPRRSAKRVFYLSQVFVIALLGGALAWVFAHAPGPSFAALHVMALILFAAAIAFRLAAASSLTPVLSRLAEPQHWPVYTILCPVYREAVIVPDLVAAIERLVVTNGVGMIPAGHAADAVTGSASNTGSRSIPIRRRLCSPLIRRHARMPSRISAL